MSVENGVTVGRSIKVKDSTRWGIVQETMREGGKLTYAVAKFPDGSRKVKPSDIEKTRA